MPWRAPNRAALRVARVAAWALAGVGLAGSAPSPAAPGPAGAALPCGEFAIHQFAADAIPRIDGDPSDWAEVGADEAIGVERLAADDGSGRRPDPASLSGRIRVGWVRGLNRLFFLYEVEDDDWDFGRPGLRNDIFELVVDGDRSGGPLIARFHPALNAAGPGGLDAAQAWFGFQNIHAQNYHIFTPPGDKDPAMAWGPQADWIKRLPWANFASRHRLQPGGGGRLTLEFWITPFDRADPAGPEHSVETPLRENGVIAMAWALIDRDGAEGTRNHFWNLSPRHTMYGQAAELCAFRLMPPRQPALAADWSFRILDPAARTVAFTDTSRGTVTARRWDFGDGTGSTEAAPVHRYAQSGKFVVTLEVSGPQGRARREKVWDVSFTGDPPP
ncbi:PKD domain-containing protein [Novosphingobium piscinae]|uniref:PKD domain-containing protein n=1 Tax=Novosphingobium piscinae TaxID=1507448 RepID=A0A7X1KNH1_9SPHN|nr:PKD domain-containing protein [Novosphingobium piscinae]MBC2667632.1 PKD domain-containing protein [Novosphingobium piscinae]